MTGRNIQTPQEERGSGASQALVPSSPVNLVDVVNKLNGIDVDVVTEPKRVETIDEKLARAGLPVYVEQGWLEKTRAQTGPPEWLSYRGQKKVKGVKQDNIGLPPELSPPLKSQAERFLMEALRIAQKDPTLEGGAFVYQQLMEAYRLTSEEGIDLFHHPSLCEEVRSPLNWFIRSSFARARTLFAPRPDLPELLKQLLVPSTIAYMFGAIPTRDYHHELVPIFEEAARTAKRQVNVLLQERRYDGETLRPVSDVVRAAEMHGTRIVVQFR